MDNLTISYSAMIAAAVVLLGLIITAVVLRRRPHKLDCTRYNNKWQSVQGLLKDAAMWPLAIIDADKLLEEALKARKYKGKTMGARLVSAQRDISNNDLVWFGHKLRNKLVHETDVKLKKDDVKDALLGMKSALKDLGAFDEK